MSKKIKVKNVFKHFGLINKHKWYVFKNCCRAGIIWRGIKHDLSKYSPTEFWESVKYYTGDKSPINNCKAENGYSIAWMHHKGRNSHHYEYWQDNFDNGGVPLQMPFDDATELLCDYLAAGQAYSGKNFTLAGEYAWWLNKASKPIAMHPQTKCFIYLTLKALSKEENLKDFNKVFCAMWYEIANLVIKILNWEEMILNDEI